MKKLYFFAVLTILILPLIGFAQDIKPGTIPNAGQLGIEQDSPINSVSQGVDILSSVVGWVYRVFFILTVLFVLLAAYKYLTKADDAEKIKEARQQLVYAAIAVVVALLSVGFSAIVDSFLTSSPPSSANLASPGIDPGREMGQ
jgi:hypothetical protein